jgi:hypothetical protein
MRATCLELAPFVEKLMRTCANSVTSEQAWSAMNFIHSKSRNTLSLKAVDKLLFIYINVRSLQKLNNPKPTDNKLLELEDRLMGWT